MDPMDFFTNESSSIGIGPVALARMAQAGYQQGGKRMLGWNIPPDDRFRVPEHWFQFEEIDPMNNYVLGVIYIVFTTISLIGNGMVIWVFMAAKGLRSPSNLFVVNLALMDFFMMAKTPVFIYNSFNQGYALGHFGCQIYGLVGAITGIGQSLTNVAIAYDRYRVIAKPMDGRMSFSKAFMILIGIYLYVLPIALLPYFEKWSRFVPEGYLTSCTFDYLTPTESIRFYVLFMFIFCYCIPMFMIINFYSQIVGHVFSHEKALREQAKKMNVESLRSGQKEGQSSAEVRIAKTAITLCALFVISWTPYAVVALTGAFGDRSLLTPALTMIPACTCKTVACLDPYVYAISHPRYRLELSKRVPCLGIKEKEPEKDAASAQTEATTPH
uniref:Opsin, ultraviolet-sensitive n=2 Tax=Cacopsylla melanoneura TaxID=428564 RepID=A0A8D8R7C2_9HEMI